MKKLEMSKVTDKIENRAIVTFYTNPILHIEMAKVQKNYFKCRVGIGKLLYIDDLIKVLKKKKIKMIVIENSEIIFKNKIEKIEITNKFTNANIKFLDLKNGENNYNDVNINEKILSYAIFAKNSEKQLESNKKTVVYISIKDKNQDSKVQKYISEEIVKDYANKPNITISEYYVDYVPNRIDLKSRLSLNELLKNLENEDIGQILIPDINHISRSATLISQVLEKILKSKVKVVCCLSNLILG